jgi:hypothetical protein
MHPRNNNLINAWANELNRQFSKVPLSIIKKTKKQKIVVKI